LAASQPTGVPWINAPGTPAPASEPSASQSVPAGQWPPCPPTQLIAAAGNFDGGAGTVYQHVRVTNTGITGCSLTGAPSDLVGTHPDGNSVALNARNVSAGAVGLRAPAELAPGESAQFALTSSDVCPAATSNPHAGVFQAFSFRIGNGPRITVNAPENGEVTLPCAIDVSDFGMPPKQQPSPVDANPLHVLTVTTSMPDTVTAGSTVHYQVTLTNPTAQPVSLDPCPVYTEFLAPALSNPRLVQDNFQLNCAGAGGSIPAHGAVTFDMQVPAPTTAGMAKFGWMIPAAGLDTGRALTITEH
jgi:hypothetical protein